MLLMLLLLMIGGTEAWAQRNLTAADFNSSNCSYSLNTTFTEYYQTYYGDGNNVTANYADLTGYGTLILRGTPNGTVRVFFNRGNSTDGDITQRTVVLNSSGYGEVDLVEVYNKDGYLRLNSIKHGSATDVGVALSAIQVKVDQATVGTVDVTATPWWGAFSNYYEIDLGADYDAYEFSFTVHGPANYSAYDDGRGWTTHNPWTLIGTNVQGHNATNDPKWVNATEYFIAGPQTTNGLTTTGNAGLVSESTNNLDNFHQDMTDAKVTVVTTWSGGVLTVKATMKSNQSGNRVYTYTATSAQNAYNGKLYLSFTKDHSYLTDFQSRHLSRVVAEWPIFEAPATSAQTWNNARISTDFKVDTLNGNWKQRGYSYKNLKALNQQEITINGKKLFPGIYFSGEAAANNDTDLGAVELSPKDYRVFLNKTTGANGSFTLKNVPAGYYIWVQAYTNVTRGESENFSESDKLSLSVTTTASSPATRADADVTYTDNSHRTVADEVKMLDKHMFCYKVWEDGDYTIAPAANGHACYVYYVAVTPCPITLLSFDNFAYTTLANKNNYTTLASTKVKTYATVGQSFTPPTLQTRSDNVANRSIAGNIIFTSDDPTVATVNPSTGAVTIVGPGTVTITATLKEGTQITVTNSSGTSTYINPYDLSASYSIEVSQNGLGKYQIAGGTFPGLWGLTKANVNAVKENLVQSVGSQYSSSILQIFGLPSDLTNMTDYAVTESTGQATMYYGSWKYWPRTGTLNFKDGTTYHYYNDDGDGGTVGLVKDGWESAKTYTVGNETAKDYQSVPLDGFANYTAHKSQNAKGEFLYTNKNTTKNADGTTNTAYKTAANYDYAHDKGGTVTPVNGVGNPYTVPCFGDYVKFEPNKSGTITAYVLQNGTINFDANNSHLTNSVSWRPLYIVDEAGKRVDGVKAVTKQKVLVSPDDVTIDVYQDGESNAANYLTDGNGGAVTYQSFVEAAKAAHPQFGNSYTVDGVSVPFWPERGEVEQVWGPDVTGDGWIIISKAYVKYQIPVKAGKTYYLFMNNSKIGICGYTFLAGTDENNASVTISENDNAAATTHENVQVTLKHGFHTGWNSICLPFSMTESKVREWFGTNDSETHELVTYNGADYLYAGNTDVMRANFFHHVWQDIIAGMPYMLYIPEGAKALTQDVVVDHVTIEGVPTNSITYSKEYMPAESRYYDSYNEGWFTFKGIYTGETMPEGSYLVSTEGLYLLNGAIYSPGYRAYITPPFASSARKRTLSKFDFENILEDEQWSNDATVINDIAAEWGIIPAPTTVYNLQGQAVRQNTLSLDGLPQGIYIVNGKKYLVK